MGYDDLLQACLLELFAAEPLQARRLLGDIVEDDYPHAEDWAWAQAFIACPDDAARRACLEAEIRRRPANAIAQRALALFEQRGG